VPACLAGISRDFLVRTRHPFWRLLFHLVSIIGVLRTPVSNLSGDYSVARSVVLIFSFVFFCNFTILSLGENFVLYYLVCKPSRFPPN
jgi:hypothetical protein